MDRPHLKRLASTPLSLCSKFGSPEATSTPQNQSGKCPKTEGDQNVNQSIVSLNNNLPKANDPIHISKQSLRSDSHAEPVAKTIASDDLSDLGYKKGESSKIEIKGNMKKNYNIISLIGSGTYSNVFFTREGETNSFSAMKVSKPGKNYSDSCQKEAEILKAIHRAGGHDNIVGFFDTFYYTVGSEKTTCIVSELLGPNLESLITFANQKQVHVDNIQKISIQLLSAIDFLHTKVGFIHADIKPENIMLKPGVYENNDLVSSNLQTTDAVDLSNPKFNGIIKLGDFGISLRPEESKYYTDLQTCGYRAPEVFLTNDFSYPMDIWSFGCVVHKLLTASILFPCGFEGFEHDMIHLHSMCCIFGPITIEPFREKLKAGKINLFDQNGIMIHPKSSMRVPTMKELGMDYMSEEKAELFSDFIKGCLNYDPKQRFSAQQALQHPFLKLDEKEIFPDTIISPKDLSGASSNAKDDTSNNELLPQIADETKISQSSE